MRYMTALVAVLLCAGTTTAYAEEWTVERCTEALSASGPPPERISKDTTRQYEGWEYRFFPGVTYDYICHQAQLHRAERAGYEDQLASVRTELSATQQKLRVAEDAQHSAEDTLHAKRQYDSFLVIGGFFGFAFMCVGLLSASLWVWRKFNPPRNKRRKRVGSSRCLD